MHTIEDFYGAAKELLEAVSTFAREHNLVGKVVPDHICFKCESAQVYEATRALLEPESVFLYQSYISGRRIAVIKLNQAFDTALGHITTLELSDQKPDKSQRTRFQHVELLPKGIAYEELAADLEKQHVKVIKVARPHHTTYDIPLTDGLEVKLSNDPLIEKIKREEIV